MRYLVDIVATIRISGVAIEVDSFDEAKMAKAAAEKATGSIRYDTIQDADIDGEYLVNWNSLD